MLLRQSIPALFRLNAPGILSGSSTEHSFLNLPFEQIVGFPPDPLTLAWFTWYERLLAVREANVPLARATTYYFAQAGNDSTGNGSQGNPWKTIDKANTVMTGQTGICCLFNKGDTWRENGITLEIPAGCSVGAYGTGARPKWTEFVTEFPQPATVWTSDSGAYYFDTSATIAWVKLASDVTGLSTPLQKVGSVVACRATDNSFYHSGTRLHIRLSGSDINGTAFEACPGTANNTTIQLTGDNVRMQGIRVEGYGMHDNASAGVQTYSIQAAVAVVTDEQVVEDCQVYYGGYHSIGAIGPGITTVKGCTTGLGRLGPGITMYVSFSGTGDQETIFENVTTHSGALEEAGVADRGASACQAIFGHTTSGTARLIVVRGSTITAGPLSPLIASGFSGMPTAATLGTVRCFIVEEVFDEDDDRTITAACAPPNMCQINCKYRFMNSGPGVPINIGGGFAINSMWEGFKTGSYSTVFRDATDSGQLYNCHLYAHNYGSIVKAGSDAAAWDGLLFTNCLIICENYDGFPDQTTPNISNAGASLINNAYFCVDPVVAGANTSPTGTAGVGAIGDAAKVTLIAAVALGTAPISSDNYYNAGNATYMPEYDYNRVARGTRKTIGPVNGA